MDRFELILPSSLNRRELLRAGAFGAAALGFASLSPLAQALQIPTTAKDEKEYRTRLMALGGLSLKSAQIGQQKATNPDLKLFATFEATEQTAVATVLQELKTPMPPMDAQAAEIVRQHESTEGAEFDKVFARSQLQVHQMLRELNENFLKSSKGKGAAEMHARHIATLALPTILEHIAHTTAYVAAVGG